MKQEAIEHARFRALAQVVIDSSKGVEAFEEYMKVAFPYLEAAKRIESKKVLTVLAKEVGRGPIGVRIIPQAQGKSRLRRKLDITDRDRKAADKLYRAIQEKAVI